MNSIHSLHYIVCILNDYVHALQGHPFMERLRENKFLMSAIGISSAVVVALAFGLSSDLSNTFEIVEFPEEVCFSQCSHSHRPMELTHIFLSLFITVQNHSDRCFGR